MLSSTDKAKMKMDAAIWNHGQKKATITIAIKKLKETGLGENPDVKRVIELLTMERKKLDANGPF